MNLAHICDYQLLDFEIFLISYPSKPVGHGDFSLRVSVVGSHIFGGAESQEPPALGIPALQIASFGPNVGRPFRILIHLRGECTSWSDSLQLWSS